MIPRLRRTRERMQQRGLGECLTRAVAWPVAVIVAVVLATVLTWGLKLAGATPVVNGEDVAHRDAMTGAPAPLVLKARKPLAPSTAAGYARMFAKLPRAQWGAADLTISTRLPDGRRVWLFGDTLSQNRHGFIRFVHSTAIVQSGGALHVSRKGAQVLPNVSKSRIYWIETVRTVGNRVRITAALMNVKAGDPWGFSRARADSHEADLVVTKAGDVRFTGWRGWVPAPDTGDGQDMVQVGPHHFTYGAFVHDIRLADGRWLESVNQNWDDALHVRGKRVVFNDYRPLWRSSATRTHPYLGY